jgi:putative ABC transport system substrate-binding protein
VVGYLSSGSAKGFATRLAAFRQGLLETGYREGQSVAIEYLNPTNPSADPVARDLQVTARTLGLELHVLHASSDRDFDGAFAKLVQLRVGGLVVSADPFFVSRSKQLVDLTLRHASAAIFQSRDFVVAGGLMSYGGSVAESHRQAGIYTGRILKGEKPVDLPVQQVTKFELVINLKTARALGLEISPKILALVDEVIE